jgi:crotonobetainyl-CoA:carnitine CoA-transferase CaiB-like acyl-CoA transferase
MGALTGIRVADLSAQIGGPYCTQLLADLGADVIKVERPAPGGAQVSASPPREGVDAYWHLLPLAVNRNKRSMLLRLETPAGKETLADLLRVSDVVVENFSEHARHSLGIDESWAWGIKSDLVWASLSGYGRTGPDSARPGWDLLAQARGGFASFNGDPAGPPMKTGNSQADYLSGLHLAVGILGALVHRARTGEGQLVDLALLDSMVTSLDAFALWASVAGEVAQRGGNFHPTRTLPGFSLFPCADGHQAIVGVGPNFAKLCTLIGRPDLATIPPGSDSGAREEHFRAATEAIGQWTRSLTRAELGKTLDAEGIHNEPVQDLGEMWSDPQLEARDMFVEYDHAAYGRVRAVGSPLKLSATPVEFRYSPPVPGEHTEEVLRDLLGYDAARIEKLKDAVSG